MASTVCGLFVTLTLGLADWQRSGLGPRERASLRGKELFLPGTLDSSSS